MKKLLFLLSILLASTTVLLAQSTQNTTTETIKVWGNCEMCKSKIEKAAKAAGATSANWNDETKILTVAYVPAKSTTKKIQEKIAAVGYDTQDVTATDESYNKLPGCCQYERKPKQ